MGLSSELRKETIQGHQCARSQGSMTLISLWHSQNRSPPNAFQAFDRWHFETANRPAKWHSFLLSLLFRPMITPLAAFPFSFHPLFLTIQLPTGH